MQLSAIRNQDLANEISAYARPVAFLAGTRRRSDRAVDESLLRNGAKKPARFSETAMTESI